MSYLPVPYHACLVEVRTQSGEVAGIQVHVLELAPLPPSSVVDHGSVGAAWWRAGVAVLGQVEGGAPVVADAQEQDERVRVVEPGQRGALAEEAVARVAVGDALRLRAYGGERGERMGAAYGSG